MKLATRAALSLAVVTATVVSTSIFTAGTAHAAACLPTLYTLVGSGQADVAGTKNEDENRVLNVMGTRFLSAMHDFGKQAAVVQVDYPAVDLFPPLFDPVRNTGYFGLNFNAIIDLYRPPYTIQKLKEFPGRLITGGLESSENTGVERLRRVLHDRHAACPQPNFALAGYSQGADVISKAVVTVPEIKAMGDFQYIFLFGNPSFRPEEKLPPNNCGRGTGDYNHWRQGLRPSTNLPFWYPCIRRSNEDRQWTVTDYCINNDQVCNYSGNPLDLQYNNTAHSSYGTNGYARDAADGAAFHLVFPGL